MSKKLQIINLKVKKENKEILVDLSERTGEITREDSNSGYIYYSCGNDILGGIHKNYIGKPQKDTQMASCFSLFYISENKITEHKNKLLDFAIDYFKERISNDEIKLQRITELVKELQKPLI